MIMDEGLNWSADKWRTIARSSKFDEQASAIEPDCKRLDDITRAAECFIATVPEKGKKTAKEGVWAIPMWPWNTKGYIVYYQFDAETATLLEICQSEELEQ